MVPDRELFAGGVDRARGVEPGGVHAEIDVGHERAEHDHTIAGFDVFADIVAAHRAFVHAEVERVLLADDGFAENGGGDRDIGFLRELQQFLLQPEAVHFDIGEDDRLFGSVDHRGGFLQGFQ